MQQRIHRKKWERDPVSRCQSGFKVESVTNCPHERSGCKYSIHNVTSITGKIALMGEFLRNYYEFITEISWICSPAGPPLCFLFKEVHYPPVSPPLLPNPLSLYHHHSSDASETSVSFIINGRHMKRWGKTPRERAWKQTWRVACWNRMVMWERENQIVVLHGLGSD